MLRSKGVIAFFVLPAFLIYALVLPVPILKSIYYSFFEWNLVGTKEFIGLDNYKTMFTHDAIFLNALKNTFIFSFGCILLQLPLAFLLAYWLSSGIKGTKFFRGTYFLPVIISGTSIGLLWQFIYNGNHGLLNAIIQWLGWPGFHKDWLSDPKFAIYGVLISVSWQFFGYHMVIFLAGISTISSEVIESAKIDGASGWQVLWGIVLPLVKPFLVISLVLAMTGSVKAFDNVISLTGGGPAHASDVLALHMYNTAFHEMRYGYGSAVSVVLFVLNILFTVMFSFLLRERNREVSSA
ncbi:carbohydrate ABC transporter permease [Paenibacillus cremeus]|nr:sugar ABC transporter permease [Paenibacillus cremeus]